MSLLLQAAGGAASEGEGVPAGPEGHAAAENTRPGAGPSQTQTTRYTHWWLFCCLWSSSSITPFFFFFLDISPPSIFHIPADHEPDKQLTDWLKEQGADADTIDKVECVWISVYKQHVMFTVVLTWWLMCCSSCWRSTHWPTFSMTLPKMTSTVYVYGIYSSHLLITTNKGTSNQATLGSWQGQGLFFVVSTSILLATAFFKTCKSFNIQKWGIYSMS